jgi:hypothetical protein
LLSPIAVNTADLDPNVVQLGVLIGLLTPNGDPSTLNLNTDWFNDPLANIQAIPSTNGTEIINLLETLLGGVAGKAIGTPSNSISGNWYPIKNPIADEGGNNAPTGLYIVATGAGLGSPIVENQTQTVGLGVLYPFTRDGITFTVYAYLPIIEMPSTDGYFVLGKEPVELGIEVTGANGAFGSSEVSFDGVKFAVSIDFEGGSLSEDIKPEIVLLNLRLPGSGPQNVSLIDLIEQGSIDQWISMGISILAGQLSSSNSFASPLDEIGAIVYDVLALLGLAGNTPSFNWEELLAQPSSFVTLLNDWFRSIASSPTALADWLNAWYCLRNGISVAESVTPASYVQGTGTRDDPFAIELSEIANTLSVSFTVATETDAAGRLHIYPGVLVATNVIHPIQPASPANWAEQIGVQGRAAVELIELVIAGANQSAPDLPIEQMLFPSFQVSVALLNGIDQTQPLIQFADLSSPPAASPVGSSFSLGTVELGFSYVELSPASPPSPPGNQNGARVFTPSFNLTSVKTPYGSWNVIDLTNFDQDVQILADVITTVVQDALTKFLGQEAGNLSASLTAVLGIEPPPQFQGDWPVTEMLLSSPEALEALVGNPLQALASYYQRCLTTVDKQGRPVWAYLLPSFATLLGNLKDEIQPPDQAGTADDPWEVEILSLGTGLPGLYLQAWQTSDSPPGPTELHLALEFGVPVSFQFSHASPPAFDQVVVNTGLRADLLTWTLPDENQAGSVRADWLTGVAAELEVTGADNNGATVSLATPSLAGVSLQVDRVVATIGWSRQHEFYWSAEIVNAQLSGVGNPVSIAFTSGSAAPFIEELEQLSELVVNALGLWMLEHGGRFGVTLTTALGLLPNLPELINGSSPPNITFEVPTGLVLPSNWPTLTIGEDFFTNPWTSVRGQLGQLYSSGDFAEPIMQLVGWAITGELPEAPATVPVGTFDSPWSVLLANAWGLEVLIWAESDSPAGEAAPQRLGFGLGKTMLSVDKVLSQVDGSGVHLDVVSRLDLARFTVSPAETPSGSESMPALPRASVLCNFRNSQNELPLVSDPITELDINSGVFGVYFDLSGDDGVIGITPLLEFDTKQLTSPFTSTTVGLSRVTGSPTLICQEGMQFLENLLDAFMKRLVSAIAPENGVFDELEALFELLNDLGLMQTVSITSSPVVSPPVVEYVGINIGAWDALISNPGGFLLQQMEGVLQDPNLGPAFFDHLAIVVGREGFELPPELEALSPLLAAFGLAQEYPTGFAISVEGWLNLFEHPIEFFEQQGSALLNNPAARRELISALSAIVPPVHIPSPLSSWLQLNVTGGTTISLGLAQPIAFGEELQITGQVVLDLQALSFTVEVGLSSEIIGSALVSGYTLAFDAAKKELAGSWTLALAAAPDSIVTVFDPLVIYPLPDDASVKAYLEQLAEEVPLFVLSTFAGKVLNEYVLPRYPLAANVFKAFGVASQQADLTWRVTSLTGILMHPLEWVLSPSVLGDGQGHLDLKNIGTVLSELPGTGINGPEGITILPVTDGISVDGLPYGASVTLTSNSANGVGISVGLEPKLSPPMPCAAINAGLSFGGGVGVAVNGDVKITVDLSETAGIDPCSPPAGDTVLIIESSYGQQKRGQFDLGFTAQLGGQVYPVTLVPFGGLNQFIPSGGVPVGLLNFVSQKLSAAYDDYRDELPAELITFISDVQEFAAAFDVQGIDTLIATVEAVVQDPRAWLMGQFSDAEVQAKLDAVYKLLTGTLKIGNLERVSNTAQNLILFVHELDSTVALGSPPSSVSQIGIGIGQIEVNNQSVFGLFVEPQLSKAFLTLTATAGLGLPLQTSLTDLEFMLEATVGIDPSVRLPLNSSGPQLDLSLAANISGQHSFALDFYPLGAEPNQGALLIELLPDVQFGQQTGSPPVISPLDADKWLYDFAMNFLAPLVADIVLDTSTVINFLDQSIGASSTTLGSILSGWGLLEGTPGNYALADVPQTLGILSAKEIVEKLIFGALSALADEEIIKFPSGGGIYIAAASDSPATYTDYGIRLQVSDFQVTSNASANGASSPPVDGSNSSSGATAGVEVLLQLGKWFTDETQTDSWASRAGLSGVGDDDLGLSVYLVRETLSSNEMSFHARLEMVSVGIDVKRYGNQPLVNVSGFRLGGVEPRVYLSLDVEDIGDTSFGAGIRCDDIGLPLGPKLAGGGNNSNPVAQNMLGTSSTNSNSSGGGPQSGGNGAAGTNAVNPVFSVSASYIHKFDFQLYGGQPGDPRNIVWFPIQRAFGPVNVSQIGVGWEESTEDLFLAFDGSVILAGLAVNVDDLSIGIPVTTPLDFDSYVFGLEGLNVSFEGGPVEISGGLLKSELGSPPVIEYTGDALIKVNNFSISAMGSYAVVEGHTSLFIFAIVNAPIGGPAFFFITGFSGGFGYNRNLILPAQDAVQSFPLIAGITDPSVFGGKNPLDVLNEYVPPEIGQYWFAAGIQFTSFEILQSQALLVVEFGQEFEIALLGLTTLVLPKQTGGGSDAIVYAELQLSVTFKPATGLLAVTLVLTSNSYVLDKNCRLTGGFAFYLWFGGEHRGEFVITLGGYSPFFTPPDYYPVEPRLGFNWPVSSSIQISGGAYFALTPSCVMAGGSLSASYHDGNLKAWFDMEADFLVAWQPFHYEIYISVDLGASLTVHVLVTCTLSISLSASLHIWGPRLQGTAHITWSVISFTISFGDGDSSPGQPTTIGQYSDFYNYFLAPQDQSGQQTKTPTALLMTDPGLTSPPPQSVVTASAANGLLGQFTDPIFGNVWSVRADEFALATATNVPATGIVYDGHTPETVTGAAFGIRPMAITAIDTPHTVSIIKLASIPLPQDLANDWSHTESISNAAAALWDTVANNGNPAPGAKVIPGSLVGVQSLAPNAIGTTTTPPPPIDLHVFDYDPLPERALPLTASGPTVVPPIEDDESIQIIEETVMQPLVIQSRNAVLAEVLATGTIVQIDGRLDVLAAAATTIFTAPPMLGTISTSGEPAELRAGKMIRTARLVRPSKQRSAGPVATGTILRALMRQHAHDHSTSSTGRLSAAQRRTTHHVTGRVHPAGLFATRHDRLFIEGHVTSMQDLDGGTRHDLRISAGDTLLWEIKGEPRTRTLDLEGNLPVRVVALNQFHHPLSDTVLEGGVANSYSLPAEARFLALTGLTPATQDAPQQIDGWHRSSSLVQLTPKALLGDGIIVQTQAAIFVPQGKRKVDYGLVNGAELIERNIVESNDSSTQPGWIETILATGTRTVAVLLRLRNGSRLPRASDVAGHIRVTLPLVTPVNGVEAIKYTALEADEIVEHEEETYVLYTIPNHAAQAAQAFLRLRVNTAPDLTQEGVLGLPHHSREQVKANWAELKLTPRGVSNTETAELCSLITFSE